MPLTKAAAATRRSWLHYFCANILTISPLEEKTSRRVAWRLTNNSAHDSGVVRKGITKELEVQFSSSNSRAYVWKEELVFLGHMPMWG